MSKKQLRPLLAGPPHGTNDATLLAEHKTILPAPPSEAFGLTQRQTKHRVQDHRRAKVEAAIGGWKQVIGDGLRSRMYEHRATEVDVAVHALNRMLESPKLCPHC